jgi:hypothetical protein
MVDPVAASTPRVDVDHPAVVNVDASRTRRDASTIAHHTRPWDAAGRADRLRRSAAQPLAGRTAMRQDDRHGRHR